MWVWHVHRVNVPVGDGSFQYPRRIECGCGLSVLSLFLRSLSLSVSSADRVWVWPRGFSIFIILLVPFSILGGSSVGVAGWSLNSTSQTPDFQYPRRIECGCGLSHDIRRLAQRGAFQYPRRIECGCGFKYGKLCWQADQLSVSSADRVWVWPR